MYDFFFDPDSTCPKCMSPVNREWQTQRLDGLFEHWKKGDLLQYHKYELIPEEERRTKWGGWKFPTTYRVNEEFVKDEPLLPGGMVPVYTMCDGCSAWLNAYAKISDGKFLGIVEVEPSEEEKEFIKIKPETTAAILHSEFEKRLSHLQESCRHINAAWTSLDQEAHPNVKRKFCLRCEKVLEVVAYGRTSKGRKRSKRGH